MPRRRRKDSPDEELLDEELAPTPRTRRKPRRRWRVLAILVLVIALACGAPTIIAKTPLRNLLLTRALPPGAAWVTVNDATLSWTSSQSLTGVAIVDAAGAPLLSAESITLSRSLIGLASNHDNLGKITLTRPVINLDARDGTSNLETFFARLADAAKQRATQTPQVSHDVRERLVGQLVQPILIQVALADVQGLAAWPFDDEIRN